MQALGLAPTTRNSSPDTKLRPYRLKAGRMASRRIPVLPKFGYSPLKPVELEVSPVQTPCPETPRAPRIDSSYIHVPPASPTLRYPPQSRHTGPKTVPIITTGAFWLEAAHIGDPCTISGLDHILSCGHKVLTTEPEPCASNCHSRSPPDLLQPRDIGQPFACTACIVDHLAERHAMRYSDYVAELLEAASNMNKDQEWIEEKLSFVMLAWQDEDIAEFQLLCGRGKACTAPWIEPEFRDIVQVATRERHLGRRSSRSTLAEMSRPPSPTDTVASIASRAPSTLSTWRGPAWTKVK